jgi:UDP-N-acetylglucosamine:LPS N-acetylglucosamine transferase
VKALNRGAKVLAVASGGGHWAQLMRIMPALHSSEVTFVTVSESYRDQVPGQSFYRVNDANRWNKFALVALAVRIATIVARERPDIVISTGAAPGFFALWFGRFFGARTIWIDSVTNIDHLSMSGSLVGRHADLWLTQWPHLAKPEGPQYAGAVL